MDIYFCDLCGVRVTDIDLKGGHGLRSGHDVICATCLELGHGKEWLAKRQPQLKPVPGPGSGRQGKPAVTAGAASAAAGESRHAAAALLDRARDRARTAEEDQTPAVGVQVLASESDGEEDLADAGQDTEQSELEQESGAHAELKPEENNHTNLAAAASSFSALGASAPAKDKPASHHTDDLDDQEAAESETQVDAHATPAVAIDEPASDSPFSFKGAGGKAAAGKAAASKAAVGKAEAADDDDDEDGDGERKVSQKDETLPTDRPPLKVEAKPASSITSATKRSSTKNSKAKSPKASGRGPRPTKKGSNRTVIILSCITLPFLLIMIYLTVMRGSGSHGPRQVIKINISEELRHSIADAKQDATSALNASPRVSDKLTAARDKIQAIRPKIDDFESQAKKVGMTDDDIIRAIEAVHWQDTAALIINLNQALVRIKEEQH
jgi:hypothetical protein